MDPTEPLLCPKCGKKPYASPGQTCDECQRIASRQGMQKHRSAPAPKGKLPTDRSLEYLRKLARRNARWLLESPDTPAHIRSQLIRVILTLSPDADDFDADGAADILKLVKNDSKGDR